MTTLYTCALRQVADKQRSNDEALTLREENRRNQAKEEMEFAEKDAARLRKFADDKTRHEQEEEDAAERERQDNAASKFGNTRYSLR